MQSNVVVPTESQEQVTLFAWAKLMEPSIPELKLMLHVPNGGWRDKRTAEKLKKEGVRPGFPDIFLPVPRRGHHGLLVELKRVKGGSVSAEQKKWLEALNSQGYLAVVAKGYEEAKKVILEYLQT